MNLDRSTRRSRLPTIIALLLILAAFAGPALRSTPTLAAPSPSPRDLAAIALTPDDLTEVGLTGYGIAGGGTQTPEAVAAALAFERNISEADTRASLDDAGLLQAYDLRLDLLASGNPAQSVRSTLHEHPDEEGAAGAFALLTNWGNVQTAEEFDGHSTVGDGSTLVRITGTTAEPHHALDLTFRSGHLLASVRIVDFTGGDPSVDVAERLAERLLYRIETLGRDPSSSLAPRALRLTGSGVISRWDYYSIVGGRIRYTAEKPALDSAAEIAVWEDAITTRYEVSQRLVTWGLPEMDTYFFGFVFRFADEDAASAFLAATPDRVRGNGQENPYSEISGLREHGDESLAYAQILPWEARDLVLIYETYLLRVGQYLAQIQLVGPNWSPPGALEGLAAAQTDCLETGSCAGPAALPPGLAALVEDAAGDENDSPLASHANPVPSHPRTYVGPLFGVELTYDPSTWSIGAEESDGDSDRLVIFEDGSPSTLALSAYPAVSDPETCISELTAGLADDEAFGHARPVADSDDRPVAAADADHAFAAYALAHDDGTHTFLYVECRSFQRGLATFLITQVGPLDEYDQHASARADLLAGLTLPS